MSLISKVFSTDRVFGGHSIVKPDHSLLGASVTKNSAEVRQQFAKKSGTGIVPG
jgi:hypothetical protein